MMNGTMIQYFHWYTEGDGKLWEEVQQNAEYLAELGITMVWLPPAYKANGGGFSVGYDPYDLFDLGEFDQKVEFHQIWNQRTIYFCHQYAS